MYLDNPPPMERARERRFRAYNEALFALALVILSANLLEPLRDGCIPDWESMKSIFEWRVWCEGPTS